MNLADFHFLRPWWLLALLPAAVIWVQLIKHKQVHGHWTSVCDEELLPFLLQDMPSPAKRHGWWGSALAILLTILALAGPTWQRLPTPAFRNDAALVIALDLSKSMDANDLKPSRISRARYKISDLLQKRKDGQTALLVYAGDAFTVTPLTNDTATIASQLEALNTDIMPSPGSNAVSAVEKAVALLQQSGLAKGHILLLSDGIDADQATKIPGLLADYRLSVLAIGSEEGAPIPISGGGFMKDQSGNIIIAKLDTQTLSTLAQNSHGNYQTISDNDDDINSLGQFFATTIADDSQALDNLLLQQWDEKGPWLILLVLPWAALRFRKGLLLALLCLSPLPRPAYALDWQSLWQNPDQRGQQAFQQQQYEQAAEQFNNPEWRAAAQYKAGQYQQAAETLKDSQSADGYYNRGNALAKAGQLQEALQAYDQALKKAPNHQDAQINKKQVEEKLKQHQEQPKDQQQQSSKQSQQQSHQQPSSGSNNSAQSPEQPSDQSSQQNHNQSPQQNKPQPENSNPQPTPDEQPQAAKQTEKPDKPQEAAQANPGENQETEGANQQLLKRIPDEPTGLLRRKFRYQYGQRGKASNQAADW